MDSCVSVLVIVVLGRFLATHDQIEDIVCVLFPFRREERHNITSVALLFYASFVALLILIQKGL